MDVGPLHMSPASEPSGENWALMFQDSVLWEENKTLGQLMAMCQLRGHHPTGRCAHLWGINWNWEFLVGNQDLWPAHIISQKLGARWLEQTTDLLRYVLCKYCPSVLFMSVRCTVSHRDEFTMTRWHKSWVLLATGKPSHESRQGAPTYSAFGLIQGS